MLTVADARTYFLTMAQIIPTLMIALFVIERIAPGWKVFSDQHARVKVAISNAISEVDDSVNKINSLIERSQQDLNDARKRLIGFRRLSGKRRSDFREAHEHAAEVLRLALDSKRELSALMEDIRDGVDVSEKATDSLKGYRRRVRRFYADLIAATALSAVVAEIAAILGAIGTLKPLPDIRFTAIVVTMVLVNLVGFALLAFYGDEEDARSPWMAWILWVVAFLASQAFVFYAVNHVSIAR